MKKITFFIIVLILSSFVFVSCGDSKKEIEAKKMRVSELNKQILNITEGIRQIEYDIEKAKKKQGVFKTFFSDSEEVKALQEKHKAFVKARDNKINIRKKVQSGIPGTVEKRQSNRDTVDGIVLFFAELVDVIFGG